MTLTSGIIADMSIKFLQTNYFCQANSAVAFTVQLQAATLEDASRFASALEGSLQAKPVEPAEPVAAVAPSKKQTKKKATKRTR